MLIRIGCERERERGGGGAASDDDRDFWRASAISGFRFQAAEVGRSIIPRTASRERCVRSSLRISLTEHEQIGRAVPRWRVMKRIGIHAHVIGDCGERGSIRAAVSGY